MTSARNPPMTGMFSTTMFFSTTAHSAARITAAITKVLSPFSQRSSRRRNTQTPTDEVTASHPRPTSQLWASSSRVKTPSS